MMTTMTNGPAPVTLADRIEMLDVLRGVAICGILLMNIPFMGLFAGEGPGFPPLPAAWNADWIAWGIQSTLFMGTMRGLFTMLFGAGMLLMLRRAEGPDGATTPIDVWTKRCLLLMLLGVIQWAVFMWPGEILFNYGVTGLFLLAFRTARPRVLLAAAAALMLYMAATMGIGAAGQIGLLQASRPAAAAKAAGRALTEEQTAALKAVEQARAAYHPKPADIAREVKQRTSFPGILAWSSGIWNKWNMGGEWIMGVAESLCFMLIGMALYRTGILTGAAPARTYATLIAGGYGLGLALRLFRLYWQSRSGFDLDLDRIVLPVGVFNNAMAEVARLGVTLGHVGLLALLFRGGALGRAVTLRALGRMALTVYSLQSILTSVLFYALGWLNAFGFAALMGIAAIIWIVTAVFARLWLARHEMGPAEALLRRAAYGSFTRRRAEADRVLETAPSV